eukprot:CAMPEP_0202871906 /NCGR_PEP_ID=MMETSP1391-20130828/19981_1 /ASSEMBLY_ACC=CAM_ASM_000867 /TAXON_ID=1034604 /ORGANISM="Chlamydomonas leiostraca, Strain SAG 11-49" /LENGTH=53 /DNA_ID=CAMNT_0049552829 /DNA_START=23 /DNA_END=181 /DNA_ORIENTATION=+
MGAPLLAHRHAEAEMVSMWNIRRPLSMATTATSGRSSDGDVVVPTTITELEAA